ncbi:uncharacterized protein CDV56_104485 [Aspergillus thermomutatus]|uniref:3-beta hydroxysteroid dehydrogenase/isomerase domain-containing protein n=1 Tax=Aspergillus thermomutatus TaxID=41047 RepID=A0A397GPQ3_ASPTH|nr:uncharacterized protein CDV56_104485 [Aspergillus thermomutatus]RHZ51474.1 hypothetical protein CDV56_104485 [Aspergillus thermomutatus]
MGEDTAVLKKVLISGGTGFVGAAIARAVSEKHPECAIVIIDLNQPGPTHAIPEDVLFIRVDITDSDEVCKVIQQEEPDIVIHTAGIVPVLSERFGRRLESQVRKINVDGTKNMLTAAKAAKARGFIYTSTCCVLTDDMCMPYANIDERWPIPHSSLIYGESKVPSAFNAAAAEALVLRESSDTMATCSLRPSVLCGPGDYQLLPAIHACIAKGETPFVIGDGFNLWDVTYVTNVADAHVLAAENLMTSKTAAGEAFFIQNNEPITFRDFCLAVWSHFGHIPPFEIHIPQPLAYIAGFVSECSTWMSGTTPTLSRGSVKDACSTRYASGEKARRILGYEARIGIEEGIRLSCEISTSSGPKQPSPDFDFRMAYGGLPGISHSQGGMPFSPVASLPRPGTLYQDWDHPARLPAESLRHDYELAKPMETQEYLIERNSRRNAEKVKATTRYHSQRRPSNRDEFDGPHQLLKPPSLRVIEEQGRELPHLPTNLDVSEQDRILNAVNDRLSQCAFDFVAKYQFPIPLEADKREVRIPSDREWTEWVYLLKRLATKRRIPARVLYNGQIKQFVTVLENSLEMRHAAKHQSRPIKDDRNVLQLISAGTQVAKMLKDASAMEYLDKLYVDTEKRIHDRRSRRVKFASP